MSVVGFFMECNGAFGEVKFVLYILADYVLFAICRGIIYNRAYERERCLLHREAIHRVCNVLRLIVGHAANCDLEFWIFHIFLSFYLIQNWFNHIDYFLVFLNLAHVTHQDKDY